METCWCHVLFSCWLPSHPIPLPQATQTVKYIWGLTMPKALHTVTFESVALTWVMELKGTYWSAVCSLWLCRHRTLQETHKENKNLVFSKTLWSLPDLLRTCKYPKQNSISKAWWGTGTSWSEKLCQPWNCSKTGGWGLEQAGLGEGVPVQAVGLEFDKVPLRYFAIQSTLWFYGNWSAEIKLTIYISLISCTNVSCPHSKHSIHSKLKCAQLCRMHLNTWFSEAHWT